MIILLNGCINSGKTSVAKAIVKRSIGFAHIEVDALREFIEWMPLEESIQLNIKNAITVAKNFHDNNINSIVSYPLSEENFSYINELLEDSSIEVHAVTLYPGLDKLKTNRGTRELNEWEVQRIDALYEMGLATPSFGTLIDNSQQSIDETTDSVLRIVGFKN